MVTTSMQSAARNLAAAVQNGAIRAGQQTPSVRGADWRSAVVAVVHGDGTIDTTDGLLGVRCVEAYTNPTVGDIIHVSQSGSGAWRADGRLSDGSSVTPTPPTWTTATLMGMWVPFGGAYQAPRWLQTADGVVMIQGVVSSGTSTESGTHSLFTLPVGSRPPKTVAWPAISTGNSCRQIEITPDGVLQVVNLPTPGAVVTFLTVTGQFTIF